LEKSVANTPIGSLQQFVPHVGHPLQLSKQQTFETALKENQSAG
jgi:hypothetical protein